MLLLIANAMFWPSFPPTQLPYGPAANCLVAREAGYAGTKRTPHASRGSLASPSNASSHPAANRKQAVLEVGSQDAQLRDHISRIQLESRWTETKNLFKRLSAKYSSLNCTRHDGFSARSFFPALWGRSTLSPSSLMTLHFS